MMAFRGFDNEYFFFVKDQDRKPVQLHGMTINASVVSLETNNTIVSKKCVIIDEELGSIRLHITAQETANMGSGLYELVLSYTNNRGLVLPLFTDLNMRPSFVIESNTTAQPIPLTTHTVEEFIENAGNIYSGRFPGPAYYEKANGLITVGVYTTNYFGKFWIQGTVSMDPTEDDWFDVDLGMINSYHMFTYDTGIEPFNFRSNLKWLRTKHETSPAGTVDKVVVRV